VKEQKMINNKKIIYISGIAASLLISICSLLGKRLPRVDGLLLRAYLGFGDAFVFDEE